MSAISAEQVVRPVKEWTSARLRVSTVDKLADKKKEMKLRNKDDVILVLLGEYDSNHRPEVRPEPEIAPIDGGKGIEQIDGVHSA